MNNCIMKVVNTKFFRVYSTLDFFVNVWNTIRASQLNYNEVVISGIFFNVDD